LPNVGPYIYDVSISGFTRSSIYIYDISSLRVKCVRRGFKFSYSLVSNLLAEPSDKRAVHIHSHSAARLDTSKCIFVTLKSLQSNKINLLHAWLGSHWEWLIAFCNSAVLQRDISDTCREIL